MIRVFLGYLGELCAVHLDDPPPYLIGIGLHPGETAFCAISDTDSCEDVHLIADDDFAVNPLFSCKVVVSVEPFTNQYEPIENMLLCTRCMSE